MNKTPLQFHLLAHPGSTAAQRLCRALMLRFMEPPASGGLRVPVFFTPDRGDQRPPDWNGDDGVNLDSSEHSIVLVLADAMMTRQYDDETEATFDAWKSFFKEALRQAPTGQSPHYVFGLAVDHQGFALASSEHMLSLGSAPPVRLESDDDESYGRQVDSWVAEQVDDLALEITIRAIQLLEPRVIGEKGKKAPVRFFLSHAKRDLSDEKEDAVRSVERHVLELPIHYWFDAQDIPPSGDFAKEIEAGIRDCSIVIGFLTDEYASRPWCQREIMDAKRLGVPILVVDALESGEPRNYTYLGNLPTVHWSGTAPKSEARRIVSRAVRETLRFMHNRAILSASKQDAETALAAAPEALTLVWHNQETAGAQFLYPDPPINKQELGVLAALRPNATFTTPLTRIARRSLPEGVSAVAVSISNSGDLARHGLSPEHQDTLSDEIHLYLLLAGLQIAYGGALSGDFAKGSNFTLRLFGLVDGYSQLAEGIGGTLQPILNYAPWPLRLSYTDREYNLFGKVAKLIEGPQPPAGELNEDIDDLFPAGNGFRFKSETPGQRLAWTRGLTAMRKQMTDGVQARIAIGGKLSGFSGLYPGIVEEAWMSLIHNQPLYLVSAFGGAADAVRCALDGDTTLLQKSFDSVPNRQEVVQLAADRGYEIIDLHSEANKEGRLFDGRLFAGERMTNDILQAGKQGLGDTLNNGLSDEQNRELFRCTQAPRIAELILSGLSRIGEQ